MVDFTPRKVLAKEKRFAAELLHQQCWCWGRDVKAAENLLIAFGFERHRAPVCPGSTRYEWTDGRTQLALWGFGMWLRLPSGQAGYFSRYRRGVWLLPRSFSIADVHQPESIETHLTRPLPGAGYVAARALSLAASRWCETYERWIVARMGEGYRRQSLEKWEHPLVNACEMPDAWRRARGIYERWYRDGHVDQPIDRVLKRLRLRTSSLCGVLAN